MLKKLVSLLPLATILGWFFPDVLAKYEAWQSNKIPENLIALGESAANAIAQEVDPALVPTLENYEAVSGPAITAIILAVEQPELNTIESAAIATATTLATILKSKATPEDIQAAALAFVKVLNTEVGA